MRIPLTVFVTGALLCACGPGRVDAEAEARNDLARMASTVNRLLTLNLDHAPSCSSLMECMDEIELRLAVLDTVTTLDPALRDSLSAVYRSLLREANHELRAVETAIVRISPPPLRARRQPHSSPRGNHLLACHPPPQAGGCSPASDG